LVRAGCQFRRNHRKESSRLDKEPKNHLDRAIFTNTGNLSEEKLRARIAEPKVVIVVLNWNGKRDTLECLQSLTKINYSNYDVLLVDNGSTDGSQACFRARYPEIVLLENEANLGFAEGNNVGVRRAMDWHADYVLLLNNDTTVHQSFLSELVRVAESDLSIGFVGPKIYYDECHGRRDVIAFAGGRINLWIGKALNVGKGEKEIGQYDDIKEVSFVQGACLLAKREVVQQVGLLDSTLFMYWEEIDWCTRGYRVGYSSVFVPNAKIWHKVAASSRGSRRMYYFTRNQFWFFKKHASRKQYLSCLMYFFFIQFWISTGQVLRRTKSSRMFICFLKGIRDGISTH
jgi:GT2 family glycosyltransferase